VGGVAGAVLKGVASIGGKNNNMKVMADDVDDTTGQFDAALGILAGSIVSSGFDGLVP